jgi:purine-cytosine permease-like protein
LIVAAAVDDDFATIPVPLDRRISWKLVFSAELGIATALLYMQITSALAVRFGTATALVGIAYATIMSAILGFAIARLSIRNGLGCNLFARFVLGRKGSALFSLIYGGNAFVYFAFEATIMGSSVKALFPSLDMSVALPVITFAMVPLVWFGMRMLARFQTATLALYAVLLVVALLRSVSIPAHAFASAPGLTPMGLLEAIAVMNSLVFITAFVSSDFTRFARIDEMRQAVAAAGVGFQIFCFLFSGLLGLWFASRTGESNPGVYFVSLLGVWGVIFAFATQLRINLSNMYAGSLAITNILSEGLGIAISRRSVVVLFAVGIALTLYLGLLSDITLALSVIGMFTTCFTCLVLVHGYILCPGEHHRRSLSEVDAYRWPAILALLTATAIGCAAQFGGFGSETILIAGPVAVVVQTGLYILLHRSSGAVRLASRFR